MKRGGGRAKGSAFERHIAKQVTEWTGVKFTRTPSSGGWAKTGDITPKDPKQMMMFPFNIELKKQEKWRFTQLFEQPLGGCFKLWWKQCTGDATKSKRIPMLIFSKNHEQVFCVMRKEEFRRLNLNKELHAYLRIGGLRVCLWQDVLSIPYRTVLGRLGKVKR